MARPHFETILKNITLGGGNEKKLELVPRAYIDRNSLYYNKKKPKQAPKPKQKVKAANQKKNLFYNDIFKQKNVSYNAKLELDRLKTAPQSVDVKARIAMLSK